MKNNKGLTLVELIVSVALISIVIVFLFQLLIELRYQTLNDTTKIEYKVASTLITKKIQSTLMEEQIEIINACDGTNTCLKITFSSGSYLEIKVTDENKVLSVVKKDSGDSTISEDIRQIPEKDETGYLGEFDSLTYTTSVFDPVNSSYDYKYDSLLKLEINMTDSLNNTYPIKVYYPYVGGGDFSSASYTLSVILGGGTWNGTSPQELSTGNAVTINNPTKSGYVFIGWTVLGDDSSINGTTFTMGTEDTFITANWLSYANMYTYTGSSTVIDDGNDNWRIKFLTSGTFTPLFNGTIDIFVVGGGGGGGGRNPAEGAGGGGGGGYTGTWTEIALVANQTYPVVVGNGGSGGSGAVVGGTGGTSSFNTIYSKAGGGGGSATANYTWSQNAGGAGGSGGGTSGHYDGGPQIAGGTGGSDGSSGIPGASGQGTTTREFGETSGYIYAGGGGGAAERADGTRGPGGINGGGYGGGSITVAASGTTNTGGGGGGAPDAAAGQNGGNGGSGIVIIRNS